MPGWEFGERGCSLFVLFVAGCGVGATLGRAIRHSGPGGDPPCGWVRGDEEEEDRFTQICAGQPIRRIGCNGDDVSIARMCDFIETQIKTLGNKNYPIVIIFDREKRTESCAEIEVSVRENLSSRGLAAQDIRIFVADRESEDWYLKDTDSICAHYGLPQPLSPLSGKGGVEKLMKPVTDYHETTVGVELFFVVSHEKVAEQCPIFARLIATAIEVNCRYFQADKLI